jgi:glutamate carboxypeptidase
MPTTFNPTGLQILDGIRRWVEIETPTRDADGINRLMTLVANDFAAAGAGVSRIAGRDGYGDHLSIASPWGQDEQGILVLCHLDTVHPAGTLARNPFRIEDDRAFGPGICDMKGGAYLAYAALREITRSGTRPPLGVRLLLTSDEEVGSPTSRALIETRAEKAKYVLVTEPARDGGKVVTARKGVGIFNLVARGRSAHAGGRHSDGRNAILEASRQVVAIEGLTDYRRGITFNVGTISGGTASNVVPAECRITIDMRVMTMADADEMSRRVLSLRPFNPDIRLDIAGGLNRPPYEKNPGVARLFEHAKCLAKQLGFDLMDVATGGASDGNFTAHNVATLDGLGVEGKGAHTDEEHLIVSSLVPRMSLLRRLIETLR